MAMARLTTLDGGGEGTICSSSLMPNNGAKLQEKSEVVAVLPFFELNVL